MAVRRRAPTAKPALGLVGASALSLALLGGCAAEPELELEQRLWVDRMPDGARTAVRAFWVGEVKGKAMGIFYSGSLYRGGHELVGWKRVGESKVKLRLLQEDREVELRPQTCRPSLGFDYCVDLIGDPTGVVRYQSRKRWTLRRKSADDLPEADAIFATIFEE